jgi:lycopene cyclase domain-containing protein
MTRFLYLAAILVSFLGVLTFDYRFQLWLPARRLLAVVALTVPLFLCFDLLGAARGWFASNPHLNSLIVPPGIPLEEPLLLAFLTVLSVSLYRTVARMLA